MALINRVLRRARGEDGFGLIELLTTMVMLNIGILALVTAFSSGQVALRRAGAIGTAATLAERQMELYRSLEWGEIALDSTALGAADTTYRCDALYGTDCNPTADADTTKIAVYPCTNPGSTQCTPSRTDVTGADGKKYRVDTFITSSPVTSGRNVRRVTVVVRAKLDNAILARQISDFDESTAL